APPRDSFGYLFVPLVRLLVAVGMLQASEADLAATVNELKQLTVMLAPSVPTAQNRAKQLAYQLFDHIPIIIGSALTSGVARRWKNQFNEHAKVASFAEPLPEANHNTVEGFELPVRFRDDSLAILLTTSFDNTEIQKRQQILAGYLKRRGVTCEVIEGSGEGLWAEKLSLLALGDWVSYYLALLGRIDPEAIPAINALKGELRQG
ncbi:MAG: SIS domain-containing protein, partial [Candidatus Veblenbacteria bacterium]|nr:SIS domain-containing protein [Candidatus Veblenbacteria bacterium]